MRQELHTWYRDAVNMLAQSADETQLAHAFGEWQVTEQLEDGRVLLRRDFNWGRKAWSPSALQSLHELESWPAAESEVQFLARHLNSGSVRFQVTGVLDNLLPSPDEIDEAERCWEENIEAFDRVISGVSWQETIWPIASLTAGSSILQLEDDVVLTEMSLEELQACLNTGVVAPTATRVIAYEVGRMCACVRYTGHKSVMDPGSLHMDLLEALRGTLAINQPNTVVNGQLEIAQNRQLFGQGSIAQTFQVATDSTPTIHLRGIAEQEFITSWKRIRNLSSRSINHGLQVALRRLAQVPIPAHRDDDMLTLMMAAEALYLSGIDTDRAELSYRLAVRAAIFAEPESLGQTRMSVFKLMRCGYTVRSRVAHGDAPKSKDLKIDGTQMNLAQVSEGIRAVLNQACRRALRHSSDGRWPPSWDDLLLDAWAPPTHGAATAE